MASSLRRDEGKGATRRQPARSLARNNESAYQIHIDYASKGGDVELSNAADAHHARSMNNMIRWRGTLKRLGDRAFVGDITPNRPGGWLKV